MQITKTELLYKILNLEVQVLNLQDKVDMLEKSLAARIHALEKALQAHTATPKFTPGTLPYPAPGQWWSTVEPEYTMQIQQHGADK